MVITHFDIDNRNIIPRFVLAYEGEMNARQIYAKTTESFTTCKCFIADEEFSTTKTSEGALFTIPMLVRGEYLVQVNFYNGSNVIISREIEIKVGEVND